MVLADGWEIPFKDIFDPAEYMVVIPEREANNTDYILRSIPEKKAVEMCETGRQIYDKYYSSYDGMLNAVLEVTSILRTRKRMRARCAGFRERLTYILVVTRRK